MVVNDKNDLLLVAERLVENDGLIWFPLLGYTGLIRASLTDTDKGRLERHSIHISRQTPSLEVSLNSRLFPAVYNIEPVLHYHARISLP